VLDTAAERELDDLALLASQILDTPIAAVSLVDRDRQFFKARIGLDATETPRDVAFCAHAICDPRNVLVVEDAHCDERFADNPLVTGEPAIRFYAGSPIVLNDGHPVGVLCVNDRKKRQLDESQIKLLQVLSRQVALLLDHRRCRQQLADLRHVDDLQRVLLDRASDPLCLVNADGRIKIANAAFDDLLSGGRSSVGRGIANALLGVSDPEATATLADRMRARESLTIDLPNHRVGSFAAVALIEWQPAPLDDSPTQAIVSVQAAGTDPASYGTSSSPEPVEEVFA
jgi:GAF domain-containing protein